MSAERKLLSINWDKVDAKGNMTPAKRAELEAYVHKVEAVLVDYLKRRYGENWRAGLHEEATLALFNPLNLSALFGAEHIFEDFKKNMNKPEQQNAPRTKVLRRTF